MRRLLIGLVVVLVAVAAVLVFAHSRQQEPAAPPPPPTKPPERPTGVQEGTIVRDGQGWTCKSAVDLDLVKVDDPPADAIVLGAGCTGRIGRIEVDQWRTDGVKIRNSGKVAHDLTIGGGYVRCHDKDDGAHQDAMQAMGGKRITFRGVTFDCLGNSNFFVNEGGSRDSTPTDIVCDGCRFGPGSSTTVRIGLSFGSGVRSSEACVGRNVRQAYLFLDTATAPVDEENVTLPDGNALCTG